MIPNFIGVIASYTYMPFGNHALRGHHHVDFDTFIMVGNVDRPAWPFVTWIYLSWAET